MKLSHLIIGATAVVFIGVGAGVSNGPTIDGQAARATVGTIAPPTTTTRTTPNVPVDTDNSYPSTATADDAFLALARTREPFSSYVWKDSELLDMAELVCDGFAPTTLAEAQMQLLRLMTPFVDNGIEMEDAGFFVGISIAHSCPAESHWVKRLAG
jgi:hypothetical protein